MADEKKIKSDESELESRGSHAALDDAAALSLEKDQSNGRKNAGTPTTSDLDFILDIPLEITVELGRTTMMVNDLLKLGQGSVIELSKPAGDTLEILANNRLIAKGDVVVINDKYGIRLTEVITPVERVEKLR